MLRNSSSILPSLLTLFRHEILDGKKSYSTFRVYMELFHDIIKWSKVLRPNDQHPDALLRLITECVQSDHYRNVSEQRMCFPSKMMGKQAPMFSINDYIKICAAANDISTYLDLRTRALFYFSMTGFRPSSALALNIEECACSQVLDGNETVWKLLIYFTKLKTLSNKVSKYSLIALHVGNSKTVLV